mgnify:CR=1 FL=1
MLGINIKWRNTIHYAIIPPHPLFSKGGMGGFGMCEELCFGIL